MPRSRAHRSSVSSSPSPCPFSAHTAAERAREKKLRDDPMAIVIDPLYVDCRRCGTRIKLSSKSLYDNFHWRTHRARCLKKPAGTHKPLRAKTKVCSLPPCPPPCSNASTSQSPSPMPSATDSVFDDAPKPSTVPPTPEWPEIPFKTKLDLLTTVASAAAFRSPGTRLEKDFSCYRRRDEFDEWRLRQEAIESLALLSRSV
ncbi:hypothetical protein M378DRAFT_157549 [Amanita muscaria Koide BX008]|uniref:Uncharacterized protein n=1 Tax=Amanita muscaria (strain Koide BX008) TaxID=946122 RepID=A0A0C2T0G8_AMAMK|nr:hypothetical protein M378DRAFT_157549 [Amanita muscaria Koide BX008]